MKLGRISKKMEGRVELRKSKACESEQFVSVSLSYFLLLWEWNADEFQMGSWFEKKVKKFSVFFWFTFQIWRF